MSRPGGAAWARVSSTLYMNRKIRRAGRNGREVYILALTQNASRGATGAVPAADLEPWYVADLLLITEADAEQGLASAIAANLLRQNGDEVEIVGWDDEWAWAPMTEAARKRRQRARHSASGAASADSCPDSAGTASDEVTAGPDGAQECPDKSRTPNTTSGPRSVGASPARHMSGQVTDVPLEKREDETREPEPSLSGSPAPRRKSEDPGGDPRARRLAEVAVAEINRLAGTRYRSEAEGAMKLCRALAKRRITEEDLRAVIAAKWGEWGRSERMRSQFNPAVLLKKFPQYLEDLQASGPSVAASSDVPGRLVFGEAVVEVAGAESSQPGGES